MVGPLLHLRWHARDCVPYVLPVAFYYSLLFSQVYKAGREIPFLLPGAILGYDL